MAKTKIKRELISHEPSRRATLKKRKASLFKKLKEITTLCGILACAVVCDSSDTKVDAWPSPQEAFDVLQKFKNLPEDRQDRFMMNQEAFLSKNVSKLNGQLERARLRNQRLDEELLLIEYLEGKTLDDPNRLESLLAVDDVLDKRINSISNRIKLIEGVEPTEVDAEMERDEMVDPGIKSRAVEDNQGQLI